MTPSQIFRDSSNDNFKRSPLVRLRNHLMMCGLSAVLVVLGTNAVGPSLESAAQEVDPGETNPITPSARLTLFPDQQALLAMPQNPDTNQPPSTYTDWARSADLQSLELQEAFVPALQNIEQARAASGHILSQMNEQVAVGWYKNQNRVNNTIVVDLLTPSGDLDPEATSEITPAFATGQVFPLVPAPNSFEVTVGNLSDLIDEDGIGHDEVAVCYPTGPPVATPTLEVNVTVLDYTELTESGVVQTTAKAPVEFNQFNQTFVQERLLLQGISDTILSCDTGDVNGDGVDEIVLAFLTNQGNLWVGIFAYTNDGDDPPTLEQVGTAVTLTPLDNPTIPNFVVPGFWSSVDVVTGDFNADGRLDVGISNVTTAFGPDSQLGSYPGIYVLSSDTAFNLSLESTFASAEPGFTSQTQFEVTNGTGSYGCRPWDGVRAVSSKQACETMRAALVAGLFKFNPGLGFDFDRRQMAVVYNMPFAQGGGLQALALEVSDDLQTITPLGEAISLSQQTCETALCPSSNRFSVTAGGFVGAGNVDNPQWSLVLTNWEATRDGDVDGTASGQFHGFWIQTKRVDGTGADGGLNLVWDEVLLNQQDISGIQNARLPAVAWDRTGASLYLGSPVHMILYELVRTDYIIGEPPKHAYWWPPDATNVADGEVFNVSRRDNFFVQLKDEEELDYSQETLDVTDWSIGGSVAVTGKASVTGGKDLGIAKTTATASLEVTGKVGYDYNENKEEYERDYRSETRTFTGETTRGDLLIAELQTYDIWRYPVSGIQLEDDLNAFWEISFPGQVVNASGGGLGLWWYSPPYENGNILSYPTFSGSSFNPSDCCADFTFLEEGQEVTKAIPFLNNERLAFDEVGIELTLDFSESSGSGETKTYEDTLTGSLDVKAAYKTETNILGNKTRTETSVTANINNSNSWSSMASSDANTNTSTGFKLNKPAGDPNQAYFFLPTFYLAEDGTTKVTHAVDILGAGRTFWTETYGILPDAAFKLPRRFSPIRNPFGITEWVPNQSADAKEIRGFTTRYAEPDESGVFPIVAGAVTDGDQVRLEVEVHNYSVTQGLSNLPILFEAVDLNQESLTTGNPEPLTCEAGSILLLSLNPLEFQTAVCVWDTTGFGPGEPGLLKEYQILVTLDPEEQIQELYEGTVGPGQNNQGYGLVNVADPLLTFVGPTRTPETPQGADVRMDETAIALQVDGQFETDLARVVVNQLVALRVCVTTNQTQTGNYNILINDGNPIEGGDLLADNVVLGIDAEGETCTWIPELRFSDPGERTLYARLLETREDAVPGNATDTLRVIIEPIPVVTSDFDQGVAVGLTSNPSRARFEVSGNFPYQGDLNLASSTLIVEQVFNEPLGAGELIPEVQTLTGQRLTLFARPRRQPREVSLTERDRVVVFETLEGLTPQVRLYVRQSPGELLARFRVKDAEILQPSRCGGNRVTELNTKLLLFDNEHAPVNLTFDKRRWSCRENRQGEVTALRLPPG